jgi:type II secretory pathway component PulF
MPSLLNRLLGRSRRLRATATFCETLGILLDRGTPTAEAVAQAAEVGAYGMPDLSLARVAASVKEGGRLPDAMVSELRLGKPETWILRATGAGPELPNGLREVARLCRDRATSRQTSVRECILPVLISLEGIGVLLVALGMLLPVFHLSAMLGG